MNERLGQPLAQRYSSFKDPPGKPGKQLLSAALYVRDLPQGAGSGREDSGHDSLLPSLLRGGLREKSISS